MDKDKKVVLTEDQLKTIILNVLINFFDGFVMAAKIVNKNVEGVSFPSEEERQKIADWYVVNKADEILKLTDPKLYEEAIQKIASESLMSFVNRSQKFEA